MSTNVDQGNQAKTWMYKHPAKARDFNTLLREGIKPGVYKGGNIETNGSQVIVKPFIAFLNIISEDDDQAIRVRTRSDVYLQPSANQPGEAWFLVINFTWQEATNNYILFEFKPFTSDLDSFFIANPNDVILARVEVTSGNVYINIDDWRTYGLKVATQKENSRDSFPRSDVFYKEIELLKSDLQTKVNDLTTLIQNVSTAAASQNLVYNGDFRYFAGGDAEPPDGYEVSNATSHTYSNAGDFQYEIVLGANGSLLQNISEFPGWQIYLRGKRVTLTVEMASNSNVILGVTNGNIPDQSFQSPGISQYIVHKFETTIDVAAPSVQIKILTGGSGDTFRIKRICCHLGSYFLGDLYLPPIVDGVIGTINSYNIINYSSMSEAVVRVPKTEFIIGAGTLPTSYTRLNTVIARGGVGSLPDIRGYFERAAGSTSRDPDRGSLALNVGNIQQDAIRNHGHYQYMRFHNTDYKVEEFELQNKDTVSGGHYAGNTIWNDNSAIYSVINPGQDTRPQNVNVLKTIKWS